MLLKAQSIATVPASAAGAQVLRAFERLGIGEAIKPKIKALAAPAQIIEAVAKGEAELGVFLDIPDRAGLELVGPFPADLQQNIVYMAAVAADTKDAERRPGFHRLSEDGRRRRDHQGQGHGAGWPLAGDLYNGFLRSLSSI